MERDYLSPSLSALKKISDRQAVTRLSGQPYNYEGLYAARDSILMRAAREIIAKAGSGVEIKQPGIVDYLAAKYTGNSFPNEEMTQDSLPFDVVELSQMVVARLESGLLIGRGLAEKFMYFSGIEDSLLKKNLEQ